MQVLHKAEQYIHDYNINGSNATTLCYGSHPDFYITKWSKMPVW